MIHIRALGPLEVTVDGHAAPPELLWRKNLALLFYLTRSPRLARSREHLMALLWGDKSEQAARHSLREAIRVIRQSAGEQSLTTPGDQVGLVAGTVESDVDRFLALAAAEDWTGAAALALGDVMEGFGVDDARPFEDWLAAERVTLRGRQVDAILRWTALRQRAGDLADAISGASRALALDPLSAGAVQAVMTARALVGESAEAIRAYDEYVTRMERGLGMKPDDATARLATRIRGGAIAKQRRASLPGAESRRAPLVGRDAELARLIDAWRTAASGRAALALIDGAPGAGRTRLMEEVIARSRLEGAIVAQVRAAPADRTHPWSGIQALAGGGLMDASGLGGASAAALATFASANDPWADRFPAARAAAPLPPAAALSAVVAAACAEQPVLLALDDAHWLDDDSLGSLLPLLRACASARLLVVVTAAPHPEREALDHLRRRAGREIPGTLVSVAALESSDLRRLAAWAMPRYGPADLDRLSRRLAADSAGLPLLAVELLHAVALGLDLHATPRAWPEQHRTLDQTLPGDVPEAVVASVRMGFRRLGAHTQAVLAAASILENPVSASTLGQASEVESALLAEALDEAEWARWLAADGRGYRFVARLARAIIARDLLTEGQRQRILARTRP